MEPHTLHGEGNGSDDGSHVRKPRSQPAAQSPARENACLPHFTDEETEA